MLSCDPPPFARRQLKERWYRMKGNARSATDTLGFQGAIIVMGWQDLRRCDSVAADESERNATAKVVREAGRAKGAVSPEPLLRGHHPTCFCRACRRTRPLPSVGKNTSVPRSCSRAIPRPASRTTLAVAFLSLSSAATLSHRLSAGQRLATWRFNDSPLKTERVNRSSGNRLAYIRFQRSFS